MKKLLLLYIISSLVGSVSAGDLEYVMHNGEKIFLRWCGPKAKENGCYCSGASAYYYDRKCWTIPGKS